MLREIVQGETTIMEIVDDEPGGKVGVVAHRGNVDGVEVLREVMRVVEGDVKMIAIGIRDVNMQGMRMSTETKMPLLCAKDILHRRVGIDPDHGMYAILFYSFINDPPIRSMDSEERKAEERRKPNWGQSGLLAAATNTVQRADGSATVLKYNEPPEARKPVESWRLYEFKDDENTGM